MYGYDYLKPLTDQLHQEALKEAYERHLAKQAKANRGLRGEQSRARLAWANVLGLLHLATSPQ